MTDAKDDSSRHTLEIPLATNGSAKWTIRASSVHQLVSELSAAEEAIERIAKLAGRIVSVTCGPAVPNTGGQP
jgi:hypothetical protein